jgi:hypothetical protein
MPFIQLGSVKRGQEKVRQLQMSETHKLNGTADAVLMRDSHVRRTLYQYFYTGEIDTTARDEDQAVLRLQLRLSNPEPKIIVVDQLWLWILSHGRFNLNLAVH